MLFSAAVLAWILDVWQKNLLSADIEQLYVLSFIQHFEVMQN